MAYDLNATWILLLHVSSRRLQVGLMWWPPRSVSLSSTDPYPPGKQHETPWSHRLRHYGQFDVRPAGPDRVYRIEMPYCICPLMEGFYRGPSERFLRPSTRLRMKDYRGDRCRNWSQWRYLFFIRGLRPSTLDISSGFKEVKSSLNIGGDSGGFMTRLNC